jgi:hypothetical protein
MPQQMNAKTIPIILFQQFMLAVLVIWYPFYALNQNVYNTMHILKQTKQPDSRQKKTPWLLVRERTIPTERPPLVDEI